MNVLGIETSCDETAAAVVTGDGAVLSSVVASQAELHARYGGVVPEIASRRHLELVSPVVRAALEDAGVGLDDVDRVGVTQGPGLVGALLVGLSAAKAIAWARGLPLVPVDHLQRARRVALPRARPARAAVHVPARERRPHARAVGARPDGVRGARLDARRRGRRGVRQGRPAARARVPGRGRDRPARPRRRPRGVPRSRSPGCPGSTSRSPGSRPRCSTRCASSREDELDAPPRRSRRVVPARDRRGARRPAASGGRADGRPDGRRRRRRGRELGAARRPAGRALRAALALHRQRRDDRVGRALRAPARVSRTTLPSMRTRLRRSEAALAALARGRPSLAAGGAAGATRGRRPEPRAGRGCSGSRPLPELGGRWIVVLRAPSLADRVRAAGGRASELQMRVWTTAARDAQDRAIARLAFRGVPVAAGAVVRPRPERLRRLARPATAARAGARPGGRRASTPSGPPIPPRSRQRLDPRDGRVRRGRAAVGPRSSSRGSTARASRSPCSTPASTRGTRSSRGGCCRGSTWSTPASDASAEQNPTQPGRPERHGTELAGPRRRASAGRPGSHGVAPRRVHPADPGRRLAARRGRRRLRVRAHRPGARGARGGRRPERRRRRPRCGADRARRGRRAVRLLPGRAARTTASDGALALDTLVVAPAGNDGAGRPGLRERRRARRRAGGARRRRGRLAPSKPDGARAPAIGPARASRPVRRRSAAPSPPTGVVTAPVAALPRRQVVAVTEGNALDPLFDDAGYSRVAGTAALLPTGPTTPEVVRELAAAGVRAVLVDGPIPAGSLGVDEPVEVPIVGIPQRDRRRGARGARGGRARRARRRRGRVRGEPGSSARSRRSRAPASRSTAARGPRSPRPGVGLVTSVPGRSEGGAARYGTISGSSAAAAVVAGAAALLADARPDLDAASPARRARRDGAARRQRRRTPVSSTSRRPRSVELVADPPVAALGALVAAGTPATGTVRLRNVSRRPLVVRLRQGAATTGVRVTTSRERVVAAAGGRSRDRRDGGGGGAPGGSGRARRRAVGRPSSAAGRGCGSRGAWRSPSPASPS